MLHGVVHFIESHPKMLKHIRIKSLKVWTNEDGKKFKKEMIKHTKRGCDRECSPLRPIWKVLKIES